MWRPSAQIQGSGRFEDYSDIPAPVMKFLATGKLAHQAPLSLSVLDLWINADSQDLSIGCQIGFGELGTTDLRQFQYGLNDA